VQREAGNLWERWKAANRFAATGYSYTKQGSAGPIFTVGIGYYYSSNNNLTLQRPRVTQSFLRDEWGFEAYYNLALTPWMLISPDIQLIGPMQKQQISVRQGPLGVPRIERAFIGNAVDLGFRLQLLL